MLSAREKDESVLRDLQWWEMDMSIDDARILRKAELTLHHWAEGECGDSFGSYSRVIERDDNTGKPYMCVYGLDGVSRYAIPDREAGALRRVAKLCKRLGLHYYHQGDPRGCALYVSRNPLTDTNYNTQGTAVGRR
jgi:hypothetical protein